MAAEPRRVYRSTENRMLGGVAGGLGEYLAIDPVLIRIAFVALAFTGVGVLAYVIAWIAIPEEPQGHEAGPSTGPAGLTTPRLVIGAVLVAVGVMAMLEWVAPLRRLIGPAILIFVGAALLTTGMRR